MWYETNGRLLDAFVISGSKFSSLSTCSLSFQSIASPGKRKIWSQLSLQWKTKLRPEKCWCHLRELKNSNNKKVFDRWLSSVEYQKITFNGCFLIFLTEVPEMRLVCILDMMVSQIDLFFLNLFVHCALSSSSIKHTENVVVLGIFYSFVKLIPSVVLIFVFFFVV